MIIELLKAYLEVEKDIKNIYLKLFWRIMDRKEAIDLALNLGVDPKHADQMVRGVCSLPNGTGKKIRVAVFARGSKAEEAQKAGADVVGAEELMEVVQSGEINFEVDDVIDSLNKIEGSFHGSFDKLDGLTYFADDYWFNIRGSNTEEKLRVNVEATNQEILSDVIQQIKNIIGV